MVMNKQLNQFMYGPQAAAYATLGTSTTVLGRVQSFTPRRENSYVYDVGVGEGFNTTNTYLGTYSSGGTVVFNPVDFDFLKHWIGPKSGSGTAGAPYILTEDNVIGLTSGDIQVFTFEDANITESTNTVTKYIGCVGDSFELTGAIGGKLECNASFIARNPVGSTTPTSYTAVTENSFMMLGGTWSFGSTPTALSGVQSFSITYSNSLIGPDNRDIDGRFITIPVLGKKLFNFTIDIKLTSALATLITDAHYSDTNEPNDGSSDANPTADLEFKVALTTGSKLCTFELDQCSIDTISDPKEVNGGLVIMSVSGTAKLGKSSTPIKWWSV